VDFHNKESPERQSYQHIVQPMEPIEILNNENVEEWFDGILGL
jgi:hypothetical protein